MHRLAWRSRIRHEGAELKELRAATQRRDERGPERVQKLPQRLGDGVLGQVELQVPTVAAAHDLAEERLSIGRSRAADV